MNIRTLSLDLLLLCALIHPAGMAESLYGALRSRFNPHVDAKAISFRLLGMEICGYGLLICLILLFKPGYAGLSFAAWWWFAAAFALAPLLYLLEVFLGVMGVFMRTGKWNARIVLSNAWAVDSALLKYGTALIVPIGEELVFRQLMFLHLLSLGAPPWLVITASAVCYGLNHTRMGVGTMLSKTASGAAYALLYWFSGCSLAVSLICHVTQNLLILFLLRNKPQERREDAGLGTGAARARSASGGGHA